MAIFSWLNPGNTALDGTEFQNYLNWDAPATGSYNFDADPNAAFGLQGLGDSGLGGDISVNPNSNMFAQGGLSNLSKGIAGVNAAANIFGAWNGYNATKLAKSQLKENKRQFNMNWNAQKKTTNSSLEARQQQRVARDPNAMSVSDYMTKYGI